MRNRLLGALAAGSLLLAVPLGAAAQTEDPCYVDPTSPECIGADDAEVDDDGDVDDGEVDDGEVDDDGIEVADDGTEVDDEVVTRTSSTTGVGGATTGVLARTGLETGTLVALFVGLIAAGGALLLAARRRSTT
jgi:LPXTG-motif cell wall-anchored protein